MVKGKITNLSNSLLIMKTLLGSSELLSKKEVASFQADLESASQKIKEMMSG
jgi:hypothetical protein